MGLKLDPTRARRQSTVKSVFSREDTLVILSRISVCDGLDLDLTIRSDYYRIKTV
jgi:hypothetical protein